MKATTQLRTERGYLQDMKLSVFHSTSRQGRVSSLTATKEADEDFYDPKYLILEKMAAQPHIANTTASPQTKKQKKLMNLVYTVNQGGK
jgi:hypothetical protein